MPRPKPNYGYRCHHDPFLPRKGDRWGNRIASAIREKRTKLNWSGGSNDIAHDKNGVEWKIIHNHFKSEIYLHRNGEYFCHLPRVRRFECLSYKNASIRDRVVAEYVMAGRLQGGSP